jgi:type II secretory pathway pseudopilin PulG
VTRDAGTAGSPEGGFTFIEALIVFAIIALLVLIAFPLLERGLTRANVRNARTLSIGLYQRARASALETGRVTTLTFAGNVAVVTATPRLAPLAGSTDDTLGGPHDLMVLYGVTVTGNPTNILTVDPRGLASSNATTIYFTRLGKTDSMSVSGFGRVVK